MDVPVRSKVGGEHFQEDPYVVITQVSSFPADGPFKAKSLGKKSEPKTHESMSKFTHIILRLRKRQILILRTSNIGDMLWARHDNLPRIEELDFGDGLGRSILSIAVLDDLARVGDEADGTDE